MSYFFNYFLFLLESSEVHSEENKVSSEKDKKRRLKTPAQVMALERFYNGMITYLVISSLRLSAKCPGIIFSEGEICLTSRRTQIPY